MRLGVGTVGSQAEFLSFGTKSLVLELVSNWVLALLGIVFAVLGPFRVKPLS